jgi:hypothetical protein
MVPVWLRVVVYIIRFHHYFVLCLFFNGFSATSDLFNKSTKKNNTHNIYLFELGHKLSKRTKTKDSHFFIKINRASIWGQGLIIGIIISSGYHKNYRMKKILISMNIFLVVFCIQPLLLKAQNTNKNDNKSTRTYNWTKAKNNSWPGVINEQTYWYKLDGRAELLWSADGKKWEEDTDGMWADKEGVFYKIDGTQLAQSTDAGNTWNETPEWQWQAVDGRWYKLDKDRVVWVSK